MAARIAVLVSIVFSSILLSASAASALPCSGDLPNGGWYDLGSSCHSTWAVVDAQADEVLGLVNELVDNTEEFANEIVAIVCGTVSCP